MGKRGDFQSLEPHRSIILNPNTVDSYQFISLVCLDDDTLKMMSSGHGSECLFCSPISPQKP